MMVMNIGAFERLRAWLADPNKPLHMQDINWLVKEVEAMREYRGEFAVAHHRVMEATAEAGRYKRRVEELEIQIETMKAGTDLPLWRRISMQRRALREMTAQVNMYRRWWRQERDRNNG